MDNTEMMNFENNSDQSPLNLLSLALDQDSDCDLLDEDEFFGAAE